MCCTTPIIADVDTAKKPTTARRLREIIARILLYSSLALWFSFIGLFEHYSQTRPTVENPEEGRNYRQNNHGYYTYLTEEEHSRLTILEIVAPVLFLSGSLVDPERRMWRWRRSS